MFWRYQGLCDLRQLRTSGLDASASRLVATGVCGLAVLSTQEDTRRAQNRGGDPRGLGLQREREFQAGSRLSIEPDMGLGLMTVRS